MPCPCPDYNYLLNYLLQQQRHKYRLKFVLVKKLLLAMLLLPAPSLIIYFLTEAVISKSLLRLGSDYGCHRCTPHRLADFTLTGGKSYLHFIREAGQTPY